MKAKQILLQIIFLHAVFFYATAQDSKVKFNLVERADGIPVKKITSITEDAQGYMWFAGEGEMGIYRYDGLRWTVFKHDHANPNSLSGNTGFSVCADKN